MRIHATFLVFHNGYIVASSDKPQTPFPSAIMGRRQPRNQNNSSSGEEFSSTVDTDNESVSQTQDNWTFPVVSHKARREEYETASKFPDVHCKILLTRSYSGS
jgi:hypothetical protein